MVEVGEVFDDRVVLALESVDRLLLNGYVPTLQVGGQMVNFLCAHRGNQIPSPALLERMTKDFVRRVEAFAHAEAVPVLRAEPGKRKEDLVAPYVRRLESDGREGVAAIVVAREKTTSFRSSRQPGPGAPRFRFYRASAMVKVYVVDRAFGPAFIKVSTYFPFPVRVCVNGHEYALTVVFDRPLTARRRVETLARDAIDLGRPEHVAVLFGRRHTPATPASLGRPRRGGVVVHPLQALLPGQGIPQGRPGAAHRNRDQRP